MAKWMFVAGGIFAGLAVILGAFAAHGLKNSLAPSAIAVFQTGVQYQMSHALALILFALLAKQGVPLQWAAGLLTAGIICFSGSLYLLAITGVKWFGPITPLGGLMFIVGWLVFVYQIIRFEFK